MTWVLMFMELPHQPWTRHLQVLLAWKKNKLLSCLTHYFFGFLKSSSAEHNPKQHTRQRGTSRALRIRLFCHGNKPTNQI